MIEVPSLPPKTCRCSLDTSFSLNVDSLLTAQMTLSVSQSTGFSLDAYANVLGLSSHFTGTIDDSGFSISASQSLTVHLEHTATIDCCTNNCCVSDSTPWYEAGAEDALCYAGGYTLQGCYWEMFPGLEGGSWVPRCQNLVCSPAAMVFRDVEGAIAGEMHIGSFTASYTVTMGSSGGVGSVSVAVVVSYTPSSTASSTWSMPNPSYIFASMTGGHNQAIVLQTCLSLVQTPGQHTMCTTPLQCVLPTACVPLAQDPWTPRAKFGCDSHCQVPWELLQSGVWASSLM